MKRAMVLLASVGFALTALTGQAPAGEPAAERVPTTFSFLSVLLDGPVRAWTGGHISHIRDEREFGIVSAGDIGGTISLITNRDADVNSGEGTLSGTFAIVTFTVIWEGTFRGKLTSEGASGKLVAHDSEGRKLSATFIQVGRRIDPFDPILWVIDGVTIAPPSSSP